MDRRSLVSLLYVFPSMMTILGNAQNLPTTSGEQLKIAATYFTTLPDFDLSFTVENENMSGVEKSNRRFLRVGNCWRYEITDQAGSPIRVISFDGATYYDLLPDSKQLNISSDISKLSHTIFFDIALNPLFFPVGSFFRKNKFDINPSTLFHASGWLGAHEGWETSVNLDAKGPLSTQLTLENVNWKHNLCYLPGSLYPERVTQTNKSWGNSVTEYTIDKPISVKLGDRSLLVPPKITTRSVKNGEDISGDVVIETNRESVRLAPERLTPKDFAIPRSSAPLVWDADIGAYVK